MGWYRYFCFHLIIIIIIIIIIINLFSSLRMVHEGDSCLSLYLEHNKDALLLKGKFCDFLLSFNFICIKNLFVELEENMLGN